MARLTDSLSTAFGAVSRLNPFARSGTSVTGIFDHQLAIAAYMSSGLMRKVIAIPAEDRVRAGRDWQAENDQIEAIEAEEKRLKLTAKLMHAELLRGIGGGALLLITAGDHSTPLNPETVRKGGLIAINVLSRWQLRGEDWDLDLASPTYGEPRMFRLESSGNARENRIHPSRVICFRGAPLPAGHAVSDEERFWGDSRLLRVCSEVRRSDDTSEWFSALVRKAKLIRVGIPFLEDMDQATIDKRVATIALGESSINATVYRAGGGTDDPGESITDYQVTWNGIPAMMDAFDQRVAAVADIPFTRLMGRSPAGMNSTGEHDMNNWNRAVASGQELEMRPCLEALDPVLLRSAGVDPKGVWWSFAPLDTPSEKEVTDRFKVWTEAMEKVRDSGTIPEVAFIKGYQNGLTENGFIPGIEGALAEIPEAERFGLSVEPDGDDPSALQAVTARGGDPVPSAGEGGSDAPVPVRRAANDARFMDGAAPRTLYVERKLLNAAEVIRWAKSQGIATTLAADDMHVTIAYSRTPVDWFAVGTDWGGDENGGLRVKPGGARAVERLGDGDAVALLFQSDDLRWRHERIAEAGASWDWPDYRPHVTLSWQAEGVDVAAIEPYQGPLVFGPELFSEVNEDWKSGVTEK